MKSRKLTVFFVLTVFMISITACAGVPAVKTRTGNLPEQPKTPKELKLEKEEQTRSLFVEGISTFTGLVIGGLAGLLTSPKKNAVTSTLVGCVVGGAVGFGLGMVIFDHTKPGEPKPDDDKVKQYFQDYKYIQLEK